MELKFEDLTKNELLRVIRKFAWIKASPRDLLIIRWETLSGKARELLNESIKASEARDWHLADRLYNESEKVSKKADAVWAAYMRQE